MLKPRQQCLTLFACHICLFVSLFVFVFLLKLFCLFVVKVCLFAARVCLCQVR